MEPAPPGSTLLRIGGVFGERRRQLLDHGRVLEDFTELACAT